MSSLHDPGPQQVYQLTCLGVILPVACSVSSNIQIILLICCCELYINNITHDIILFSLYTLVIYVLIFAVKGFYKVYIIWLQGHQRACRFPGGDQDIDQNYQATESLIVFLAPDKPINRYGLDITS